MATEKAIDEELERERAELLAQLREANKTLETAIGAQDEVLAALEVDRIATAKACSTSILETELLQLGRPALLAKMRATASGRDRLSHWRDALQADVRHFPREAARLQSELEILEDLFAKADGDAHEAFRKAIDE